MSQVESPLLGPQTALVVPQIDDLHCSSCHMFKKTQYTKNLVNFMLLLCRLMGAKSLSAILLNLPPTNGIETIRSWCTHFITRNMSINLLALIVELRDEKCSFLVTKFLFVFSLYVCTCASMHTYAEIGEIGLPS